MRGDNSPNRDDRRAVDDSAQTACLGRVAAVNGDAVLVQVNTVEACEACRSKGGCHQAQLAGREVTVTASGFVVGDRVRLITTGRAVLRASLVLYGIPALLAVVGAFAGYSTATAFLGIDGDLGSMLGTVTGLLLGAAFIYFYRTVDGEGLRLHIEKVNEE